MNSRAQVSLESLLLWAALAGMLALFTPVFSEALHAQTLAVRVHLFDSFAGELSSTLNELSFSGEGTTRTIPVPKILGMQAEWYPNSLTLVLPDSHFIIPKEKEVSSPLPLSGNPSLSNAVWVLTRNEGGITIR